jgi:tripeptide aminopeptidase
VRPASEVERRRLNDLFAELCAIPSVSRDERACADRVTAELRGLGLEVIEDGAGAEVGANAGNLLARMPGRSERSILLCSHLDTVPHGDIPIEPVVEDGGWINRNEAILGADNKAAVAVMLALAHRIAIEGSPVGVELLFTVCEETALAGAKAFDVSQLRSEFGYTLDHATPIGEVVVASPTYYRIEATFLGKAAHAGLRPEDGRNAIQAAAHAIGAMRLGRLDEETTANVGSIQGGDGATNVVPDRCTLLAETRSLSESRVEEIVAEMVDHLHDAANVPAYACDLDVSVERLFAGYRHSASAPAVLVAEEALRACGYTPKRILTGSAADTNAFEAAGFPSVCLANGTERNHEPTERVSVAALEGMLDVTLALLDAAAAG